jgi:GGDEF domain-containing protein
VHAYDAEIAERTLVLAIKVDEFALLLAGETEENVASVLDAVQESLRDKLSWAATELFVEAVRRRKRELERNVTVTAWCQ